MSAAQPEEKEEEGVAGRKAKGGRIPQDVQQQARQKESPVVSELLVAARKGLTERVVQLLHQNPDGAAITDKVSKLSYLNNPSIMCANILRMHIYIDEFCIFLTARSNVSSLGLH